jgi:hypothetical protein
MCMYLNLEFTRTQIILDVHVFKSNVCIALLYN